MEGEIMWQS